jgi:hypothetical protein
MTLLVALAIIGAPAALLRSLCIGHSCDKPVSTASEVPFCSLPERTRSLIEAGFREGRSPDLLVVTNRTGVAGSTAPVRPGPKTPWPSLSEDDRGRIPIVFAGAGVDPGAEVPAGTALEDVAPTEAEIIGLRRPHPEVRSGEAVEGVAAGRPPRLLLEIVLKGTGSKDLESSEGSWPQLASVMESGVATMDGQVGFWPLDPAAALMTLGTGGSPHQHGVTGSLVRNNNGKLAPAWGAHAPVPESVIATLGDDLDQELEQKPRIGVAGTDAADRGAIGGDWYIGTDEDEVVIEKRDPAGAAVEMLEGGVLGADDIVDFMVVSLRGTLEDMDAGLGRVVAAARRASGESLSVVVTATGSLTDDRPPAIDASQMVRKVERAVGAGAPVIAAAVPGGFYLDQRALARLSLPEDDILAALRNLRSPDGAKMFGDTFPAIAVSFARYC